MIKNLLFDLDGTLIDPKVGITTSVRHAMAQMARPLPAEANIDWCIGPPLRDNFATLLQSANAGLIETAVRFYREHFGTVGLFECSLYADIVQTLAQLQGHGLRLFLATAKPTVYAAQILDRFQLTAYFDGVYGSELDGRFSQKHILIQHILQQEQLMPGSTAMIGDRHNDMQGAKTNGIQAWGVLYGYGRADELTIAGADRLIATPAQILSAVLDESVS